MCSSDFNDCGCGSKPRPDDTNKVCDFNSECCGDGLVKQQYSMRTIATDEFVAVYQRISDIPDFPFTVPPFPILEGTIQVKNFSQTEDIFIKVNDFDPIEVKRNREIIIPAGLLKTVEIRTKCANTTAGVLICFELLFCSSCAFFKGGGGVNPGN